MSHVRGPFIEFECTICGRTVAANAHRRENKVADQIAELNADPAKRICAACCDPINERKSLMSSDIGITISDAVGNPATECRYCGETKRYQCMNTRDMELCEKDDDSCAKALTRLGGGENTERQSR